MTRLPPLSSPFAAAMREGVTGWHPRGMRRGSADVVKDVDIQQVGVCLQRDPGAAAGEGGHSTIDFSRGPSCGEWS